MWRCIKKTRMRRLATSDLATNQICKMRPNGTATWSFRVQHACWHFTDAPCFAWSFDLDFHLNKTSVDTQPTLEIQQCPHSRGLTFSKCGSDITAQWYYGCTACTLSAVSVWEEELGKGFSFQNVEPAPLAIYGSVLERGIYKPSVLASVVVLPSRSPIPKSF